MSVSTAKRCFNTAEAMHYLGIKRRSFEAHILPALQGKGVRIGNCIVFEKADLDEAWDAYKLSAGSEGLRSYAKGEPWSAKRKSGSPRQVKAVSSLIEGTRVSVFDAMASELLRKRRNG